MFVGTHSLDEEHWKKMTSVTDEKKARLWNGLLDGFEKYLGVLTEKAWLIQETDALRRQVRNRLFQCDNCHSQTSLPEGTRDNVP